MSRSIGIDARMINASGIGTYLQGLLNALSKENTEYKVILFGDPESLPIGSWSTQELTAPIYSIREQFLVPRAMQQAKLSFLHVPHYNLPYFAVSRTVVTVHDVIHLKFSQYWPSPIARAYANFFFHHVVPQARAILTVSESTKRDLMEMLSLPADRITVTYPGVHHDRFQNVSASTTHEFNKLNLPKDYLLYIGNLKEFKNVERLLDAYQLLREQRKNVPELVLVGRNFIRGFDKRLSASPGVHWLGEAPRNLLPALYKHALAFIFISLYEGFGLPPLEAMASGTPVLCSNRASLPEVVGDAALMVDPENLEAVTTAMAQIIQDSGLRKQLSAKGLQQAAKFSWDKMAAQTLQVYKQCLH